MDYTTPPDLMQEMRLSPHYYSATNTITQPDHMIFCSVYLAERWLPDLGGDGLAVLIWMRRKCYFNRKTGEKRNVITVSVRDIASGCDLSPRSVYRLFEEGKPLRAFITPKAEYIVNRKDGGVIQTANSYTVCMDDPVHPLDFPRLEEELRRRAEHEPTGADSKALAMAEWGQIREQRHASPLCQNDTAEDTLAPCQNGTAVNNTPPCQNGVAVPSQKPPRRSAKLADESNHDSGLPVSKTTTTTAPTPTQPVVVSDSEDPDATVAKLVEIGVKPTAVAAAIVARRGPEVVQDWIAAVQGNFVDTSRSGPAAFLVRALGGPGDAWDLPNSYKNRVAAAEPAFIRTVATPVTDTSSEFAGMSFKDMMKSLKRKLSVVGAEPPE